MVRIHHSARRFSGKLAPQIAALLTALAMVGPIPAACDCPVAPAGQAHHSCCDACGASPLKTGLAANTCANPCRVAPATQPVADVVVAQGMTSSVAPSAAVVLALDPAELTPAVAASPPLLASRSRTILRI
jgi:hypothetical protein